MFDHKVALGKDAPINLTILLGATPLLLALAPFAFIPHLEGWQIFVRTHSFIIGPIELAAMFLLMRNGSSLAQGWKVLPVPTRLAVIALVIISIAVSFQPDKDHLAAAIGLSRLGFAALFALALLGHGGFNDQSWRLIWAVLAIGTFAYFGLFVAYVSYNDLRSAEWISHFPGFNNIRHVAFLGLIGFSGGLAYAILSDQSPNRALLPFRGLPIGIAAMVLVLWTGSRGPLLATSFLTLCCVFYFQERRRTILIYSSICFLVGIVVVSQLPIPNPIYGLLQAFGIADVRAESLNGASSGRLEVWRYTYEEAVKRPFFGWGINQYSHFLPDGRERMFHPHNYPLQLLFASGFVGALLIVVAAASLVWECRNALRRNAQKFNGIMVGTLMLYSLYDGILYFAYPMMIFTLVLIGSIHSATEPDIKKQWKAVRWAV